MCLRTEIEEGSPDVDLDVFCSNLAGLGTQHNDNGSDKRST